MELFTIIVMNPSESYVKSLSQAILGELQRLHKDLSVFQTRYEIQGQYAEISGSTALMNVEIKKIDEHIAEGIAFAVADHIISCHEPLILRDMIKKELKLDTEKEVQQVEGYCKQFLNNEDEISTLETGSRRRTLIADQVQEYYLQEQTSFNLDGFLKFRVQEYLEELREIVDYAMDEYLMDRQYQEFISLLKYFVYIQEAKIPTAHLIHKGGHDFVILNDLLEPIDTNEFDSSFKLEVLEKDINFEDMIVSTLITVSPANIYIHTREPEMTVIKTIRQIFEDRTSVCSYCRTCQTYLGDFQKQDQLYP
jgi:putative sporulation protein YtxC